MDSKQKYDLDTPLLRFGTDAGSVWRLRDAVCSTTVFGATGAGKTSSSGMRLCKALLQQGYGGLFLTSKVDDTDTYIRYCKETGRLDDLVIIDPYEYKHNRFNFLGYEAQNSGGNKATSQNIVQLLMTVIEAGSAKLLSTDDGGFWLMAVSMMLQNVIDLCLLATGEVTVENIYNIVQSLPEPQVPNQQRSFDTKQEVLSAFETTYELAAAKIRVQASKFKISLTKEQEIALTDESAYLKALHDAMPDVRTFDHLAEYFYRSFRYLSPKTKSTITYMVTGFLFSLLKEPVYSLFCNQPSTISPEDCYTKGKIWLVNLPVKSYYQTGQYCQMLVKYCWQRAMERRRITEDSAPVFFIADECQHFMLPTDSDFFATSRSSRICSLQLTQNLPNLYISVGGSKSEYRVKSLMGNFGTLIFHANSCIDTNEWASLLIGEHDQEKSSFSYSYDTEKVGHSKTDAHEWRKKVPPEEFVGLKNGGKLNDFKVQSIIFKTGTPFHNGENFKRATFSQK